MRSEPIRAAIRNDSALPALLQMIRPAVRNYAKRLKIRDCDGALGELNLLVWRALSKLANSVLNPAAYIEQTIYYGCVNFWRAENKGFAPVVCNRGYARPPSPRFTDIMKMEFASDDPTQAIEDGIDLMTMLAQLRERGAARFGLAKERLDRAEELMQSSNEARDIGRRPRHKHVVRDENVLPICIICRAYRTAKAGTRREALKLMKESEQLQAEGKYIANSVEALISYHIAEQTLQTIGDRFGVDREDAKKMVDFALREIRNMSRVIGRKR